MSIPPKKPSDPFKRDPHGRLDSKGSPDGQGSSQGNASGSSSSSSSSSSISSVPAPKHAGEDGYDSSTDPDDLPKNYYEIMSRERDRKNIKDASERKKNRALAATGWPQDQPVSPATFVRKPAHQFVQQGGYCKAVCAAFIQLRFLGDNVNSIIDFLENGSIAEGPKEWQDFYLDYLTGPPVREAPNEIQQEAATALHAAITQWIEKIDHGSYSSPQTVINKGKAPEPWSPQQLDHRFYEHMIGQFAPDVNHVKWSGMSNELSNESDGFRVHPHAPPSSKGARTFQEALFGALQPSAKRYVPLASRGTADAKPVTMMRCATPFVVLRLEYFKAAGKFRAHEVVVDFSNPGRPGIFDPNFGWMEPVQGFCILTLEMALTSIWQH